MPVMAMKIHQAIQTPGMANGAIPWVEMNMARELDELEPGQPISPPELLFAKIPEEVIAELKIRFSGAPEPSAP
jgi:methionyl-tRNA synthetase